MDLKQLLDNFAHDLVNHCARVEKGEIVIPEKGLAVLIKDYLQDERKLANQYNLNMLAKMFSESERRIRSENIKRGIALKKMKAILTKQ